MPRIPELPDFAGAIATDDEFAVWDKSADITYGATLQQVATAVGALAGAVTDAPDNTTPYVRQDEAWAPIERVFSVAASDEETELTVGDNKIVFRFPFAMTLSSVRASLRTASSSGLVTVSVEIAEADIFSTPITIDANETTSLTAATSAVLSTTAVADDALCSINIDGAGTGATGLKLSFIGTAPA
jgi:hypothetical protein